MVKEEDYLHLVAQARSGSQDGMNRLAVRIHDRLYSYLHRVTLDHDLSQDLLQEILLTMVRFVNRLEEPECFWPWIYRITQSKIQQHLRNQHRRQILQSAILDDGYYYKQPRNNHNVLDCIIHEERLTNVSIAIRKLDKEYRDVVQLRCFEERPYSEIASVVRCSPQQARIRFFRAKQFLRGSLFAAGLAKD